MGPAAALLGGGARLHLQHGPIDLIIGADGERENAFSAARDFFADVLEGLVAELLLLRQPISDAQPIPEGPVGRRMYQAAHPHGRDSFITPMAAVAGSVADAVLRAMVEAADISRAYVNNGGDIALHLEPGTHFTTAIADHTGRDLGQITIRAEGPIRGIATSGRHGRSLSLGIADSVTVLARTAADADAAATMIANRVDLPGHPGITRKPAAMVRDDTDLGTLPVVVGVAPLRPAESLTALTSGKQLAERLKAQGHIAGAALFLQGEAMTTDTPQFSLPQRMLAHA